MKQFIGILLFTCVVTSVTAQVNFVKNPSFEDTVKCPNEINQISYAQYWTCAVDTVGEPYYAPEYYTAGCEPPNTRVSIPNNVAFYQYPHTGNGIAGAVLYYDKTLPIPGGVTSKWRDYFQGRFHKTLEVGKTYCVSFWVNLAEASGYAHNEIGAYVDNGNINKTSSIAGEEITFVIPQVHTSTVIDDTVKWTKIEGSFIALGNETHITLGTFSKNEDIIAISNTWGWMDQYSYYLFDDVAVIPIDLKADAGKDSHAEPGKPVQIGRVGDTTAQGLDCKWYHKGILIDSGAVISVNGSAIVGTVDTYVVVQTICGLSKTDTVTVKTVPLGMREWQAAESFSVIPNPSNGNLTITTASFPETVQAKVYDLLGRTVRQQNLHFNNNTASLEIGVPSGVYTLELTDNDGNAARKKIVIE